MNSTGITNMYVQQLIATMVQQNHFQDTRFFDNLDWEEKKAEEAGGSGTAEATQQVETEIAGIKIRSRGRGTKKFLQAFKDSSDDE